MPQIGINLPGEVFQDYLHPHSPFADALGPLGKMLGGAADLAFGFPNADLRGHEWESQRAKAAYDPKYQAGYGKKADVFVDAYGNISEDPIPDSTYGGVDGTEVAKGNTTPNRLFEDSRWSQPGYGEQGTGGNWGPNGAPPKDYVSPTAGGSRASAVASPQAEVAGHPDDVECDEHGLCRKKRAAGAPGADANGFTHTFTDEADASKEAAEPNPYAQEMASIQQGIAALRSRAQGGKVSREMAGKQATTNRLLQTAIQRAQAKLDDLSGKSNVWMQGQEAKRTKAAETASRKAAFENYYNKLKAGEDITPDDLENLSADDQIKADNAFGTNTNRREVRQAANDKAKAKADEEMQAWRGYRAMGQDILQSFPEGSDVPPFRFASGGKPLPSKILKQQIDSMHSQLTMAHREEFERTMLSERERFATEQADVAAGRVDARDAAKHSAAYLKEVTARRDAALKDVLRQRTLQAQGMQGEGIGTSMQQEEAANAMSAAQLHYRDVDQELQRAHQGLSDSVMRSAASIPYFDSKEEATAHMNAEAARLGLTKDSPAAMRLAEIVRSHLIPDFASKADAQQWQDAQTNTMDDERARALAKRVNAKLAKVRK